MKQVTTAVLAAFLIWVSIAHAVPEYEVRLAGDGAFTTCTIAGDGSGLVAVHMFLVGSAPSKGMAFGAYMPSCWPGTVWLGDILAEPWLTLGTTQAPGGLSIAFGECRSLPLYLGYMNFFGAPSAPCCEMWVTGTSNDFYRTPVVVDCVFQEFPSTGGRVLLNANETCPCEQPLAQEETTWGRVKALYREGS